MAVTKQTYTAAPTWTAAQLATIFQDAFVDAGLMTAWYDSFLSGTIENRILEITYDASKTYGKAYYWFMFSTTAIAVHFATGWNATTDVPTGTQYLDYYSTATNTQANHFSLRSGLVTTTSAVLVRYTDSGYSWFSFRNDVAPTPFFIAPASTVVAPWINLNKVLFHHFIYALPTAAATGQSQTTMGFRSVCYLRRSYHTQGTLRGRTAAAEFVRQHETLTYIARPNNSTNSLNNEPTTNAVIVPYGFNNTNPAYTTDYLPVINGYSYSSYITSNMPADFGMFFPYGTTAYAFGDRIVVSAGVEEWEVYGFANNNDAVNASALIVARVV